MDKKKELKILAVADPAVEVYVNNEYKILENYINKSIQIKFDIISWEKYILEMEKALKGEKKYDIIMVAGHLWLYDLVKKGYLEKLNYEKEDILDSIFEEMKLQNTIYLSPSFCDGHMIVYRKEALKRIGKKMEDVITIDEFIGTALELKKSGIKYPVALKAHESEIFTDILPYLRSLGKDIYILDEKKEIKCNISQMSEEIRKYLKMKRLSPKNTEKFGNDEIRRAIVNKEVAMVVTWSGQLGLLLKEEENIENLGFSTLDTSWNVTWSFGILKTSENKRESADFLKYLRSEEVDAIVGEYCGAPIRKKNYLKGMKKFIWYKIQMDMIEKYSCPLPKENLIQEKNNILYKKIYEIFSTEKNIEEILKETEKIINKLKR